jgi:23S rRNA (guanosine2251-2'-O)-methyltransferase
MEKKVSQKEVVVILDNIRSTFNVGSIFRTADALGVGQIILGGTTPAPVDRFGRERADIAKVSLGAEKTVAWKHTDNVLVEIKKLKKAGYQIIAIEQAENSVDYKKIKLAKNAKVVFVMGAEVEGVNKKILKIADIIAEIPMLGQKESLNVSVSFGVALFRLLNI